MWFYRRRRRHSAGEGSGTCLKRLHIEKRDVSVTGSNDYAGTAIPTSVVITGAFRANRHEPRRTCSIPNFKIHVGRGPKDRRRRPSRSSSSCRTADAHGQTAYRQGWLQSRTRHQHGRVLTQRASARLLPLN